MHYTPRAHVSQAQLVSFAFSVDLTFYTFSVDGTFFTLKYRRIFNFVFHVYKILLFRWHILVPVFHIDLFNFEEMKLNVKVLVL